VKSGDNEKRPEEAAGIPGSLFYLFLFFCDSDWDVASGRTTPLAASNGIALNTASPWSTQV